ncbi:hypothetical protein LXL04_031708 [Taraxacum kok-saghyz]
MYPSKINGQDDWIWSWCGLRDQNHQSVNDIVLSIGDTVGNKNKKIFIGAISYGTLWELNVSLEFSVAVVRSHLDEVRLPSGSTHTRWNRFLPIKINVFVWRVALNRLPTRCNLVQKGIDLETIMCPLCQREVESLAHTLFRCEVAIAVWGRVAIWCDAYMPVFESFGEMIQWV